MKEIPFRFDGIKVGHAEDSKNLTGLTVLLFEEGYPAGVCVAGGGPASRETTLLSELSQNNNIHGVVLSGGSAFGLGAADGVLKYLNERGYGYDTGFAKVPLVVQSDLYDLGIGSPTTYPDAAMAYRACENAEDDFLSGRVPAQGNVGAGTGATVGKLLGPERMMKSGIGTYAVQVDKLVMGCIIAVNALGDVYDIDTGEILAGLLSPEKDTVVSSRDTLFTMASDPRRDFEHANTTIGCLVTNGIFDRAQLNKIAQMAQDGYAQAISPVHTTADGDTIYVVSTEEVEADLNLAGTLAAYVTAKAIARAVLNAEGVLGVKAYRDL